MAHFYLSEGLGPPSVGESIAIGGAEARHAVSVSRVRSGDTLTIGNGAGLVVTGAVTLATPDRLEVTVRSAVEHPPAIPAIRLAQALAKGDRDEAAVQAATELGVDGVIPWSAQRSIVKWEGAKQRKGQERWSAITREATKQSVRAWLPDVSPLVTTKQLAAMTGAARMLVLDPLADTALTSIRPDGRDIIVVVGPEGGVAPSELVQLQKGGAVPVRLGDTVLRTSTAGPAAIAVLSMLLGRW